MNVLGMGPMELVVILILALVVIGPEKLPELLGQLGRALTDFRRTTSELSGEFTRTIQAEIEETRATLESEIAETKAVIEGTPSPGATPSPVEPVEHRPVTAEAERYMAAVPPANGEAPEAVPESPVHAWRSAEEEVALPAASPANGTAPDADGAEQPATARLEPRRAKLAVDDDLLPPY